MSGFDARLRAHMAKLALPEDELTNMARARHWRIFGPKWGHIREFPALDVRALCGLSVGLKPYFANPAWVERVAIPHFTGQGPDEFSVPRHDHRKAGLLREFARRVAVAAGNLEPIGTLGVLAINGGYAFVSVSDFAAMAAHLGWTLPAAFPVSDGLPKVQTHHDETGKDAPMYKQAALIAHLEHAMKEPGKLAGLLSNATKNGLSACRVPGNGWNLGEVARWLFQNGYLKDDVSKDSIESIISKALNNS